MAYQWNSAISSSLRGSKTPPAGFFSQAGKSIRITARGWVSASGANRQITPKLYLGANVIWNGGMIELSNPDSGPYSLDAIINCYSTGATGTVRTSARMLADLATGGLLWWQDGTEPANVTVDTTSALAIDWGVYADPEMIHFTTTHFHWESLD